MLGVAAQRIVDPIRKPRNNADECHCAETRRDGAFRAICFVAPLARGACHGRRVASRISSRKAAVAATRDSFRGSLTARAPRRGARAIVARVLASVALLHFGGASQAEEPPPFRQGLWQ